MGDLLRVERVQERIVIDQWAASRVYHEGAFRHEAEAFCVENILGCRCGGKQEDHDMGPHERALEAR